jgi:hypothetical protein
MIRMKKRAKVTCHRLLQDSQELGSDDEFMVSRAIFSLEIGGDVYTDLHVELKQVVGSDYRPDNIEVGPPQGYDGPFNHQQFRDGIISYYFHWVGPSGKGIRVDAGSSNIRMLNNEFVGDMTFTIDIQ